MTQRTDRDFVASDYAFSTPEAKSSGEDRSSTTEERARAQALQQPRRDPNEIRTKVYGLKALSDDDYRVRMHAAEALGKGADARGIEPLKAIVRFERPNHLPE